VRGRLRLGGGRASVHACTRRKRGGVGSVAQVRDWQEFEGLEGDELLAKIAGMDEYLHDVLETEVGVATVAARSPAAPPSRGWLSLSCSFELDCRQGREHKDLRDVRDHIHECFEAVGTFLLVRRPFWRPL
jgi:hypothetical protein